jgi:hypothetical protein
MLKSSLLTVKKEPAHSIEVKDSFRRSTADLSRILSVELRQAIERLNRLVISCAKLVDTKGLRDPRCKPLITRSQKLPPKLATNV